MATSRIERHFRFTEDKSDKFWHIVLENNTHTVHYGRVGSSGQTQTKEFDSDAAAKKSYEKLVLEKVKKGYVEQEPTGVAPTITVQPTTVSDVVGTKDVAEVSEPSQQAEALLISEPVSERQNMQVDRAIALEPADWFYATWRHLPPLEKPQPQPIDLQNALTRLRKLSGGKHWDWSKAAIAESLSREEAWFWWRAMHLEGDTPKQVADSLSKWSFNEFDEAEIHLERLRQDMRIRIDRTSSWIMLPVRALLSAAEIGELLLELDKIPALQQLTMGNNAFGNSNWELPRALCRGFMAHVLPYMTQAEKTALRDRVAAVLDISQFPTNVYSIPDNSFFLAAALGLGERLLPLVESWQSDRYLPQYGWTPDYYHRPQEIILGLPAPQLVVTHMQRMSLRLWRPEYVAAWLAHTEYASLDAIRDTILGITEKESAQALLEVFARVRAPEAAPFMLELANVPRVAQVARKWLDDYPAAAIAGAIPAAGSKGKLATAALEFLRTAKRKGQVDLISQALAMPDIAPELVKKMRETVLDRLEKQYPILTHETTPDWLTAAIAAVKVPKDALPAWISLVELPPIVVSESRLSDRQVEAVCIALKQSTLEQPNPLVGELRLHADCESRDAFAWAIFERWLGDSAPSKDKWALTTVGLWGGDASALKLAPMIRAWPGESQHQRAVLGLDCLRAIGTDTALMQINGIAQKVKFKALQERARQCIEQIAVDRGLTRAQLEDRIVPDCGLDERGSYLFDFGARQFRFVLGEGMKPMVKDEQNKVKPDLPKPNTKDDREKAEQAIADWKLMKKQIAEVAKIQSLRLEQAMVVGRRWSASDFETLIVRHPLMVNLAQLLVWGAFTPTGNLMATFRVTEDQTYADAADVDFAIPADSRVGIVHALQLDETAKAVWGELFSDYEILQPFPQLGRSIYRLTEAERSQTEIQQFRHVALAPMTLVGTLAKLGWVKGTPMDGGVYDQHFKIFDTFGITAAIEHDGVPIGYIGDYDWENLEIRACYFVRGTSTANLYYYQREAIALEQIDDVILSEVLSDLQTLGAKGVQSVSPA